MVKILLRRVVVRRRKRISYLMCRFLLFLRQTLRRIRSWSVNIRLIMRIVNSRSDLITLTRMERIGIRRLLFTVVLRFTLIITTIPLNRRVNGRVSRMHSILVVALTLKGNLNSSLVRDRLLIGIIWVRVRLPLKQRRKVFLI